MKQQKTPRNVSFDAKDASISSKLKWHVHQYHKIHLSTATQVCSESTRLGLQRLENLDSEQELTADTFMEDSDLGANQDQDAVEDPFISDLGANQDQDAVEEPFIGPLEVSTVPLHIIRANKFYEKLISYNLDYHEAFSMLICQSCHPGRTFTRDNVKIVLPNIVATLFITVANLVLSLDKDQLSDFAFYSTTMGVTFYQSEEKRSNWIRIPDTEESIRSKILSENKFSWRSLLPIPTIRMLRCGHAHVALKDIIISMVMTSTPRDYNTSVKERHRSISDCDRFRSFRSRVLNSRSHRGKRCVLIVCIFWSDGFEPNLTNVNRGSVWTKTLSALFYDCKSCIFYMMNTKVSAVGWDKTDHSMIFRQLRNDLREFTTIEGMPIKSICIPSHYHYQLCPGESIHFFIMPFGLLMDNPERRSNFGLRSHNSLNHVYFSLNCHHSLLEDKTFECAGGCNCANLIEDYIQRGIFSQKISLSCHKCFAFDVEELVRNGKYSGKGCFAKPETDPNPVEAIPGYQLFQKPGIVNRTILIRGWKYAMERRLDSTWTDKDARKYLVNVLCISDKGVARFVQSVREQMIIQIYNDPSKTLDEESKKEIEQNITNDPDYYRMENSYFPIWDCMDLPLAFETIMHNNMNVGKALRDLIHEWGSILQMKSKALAKLAFALKVPQEVRLEDFKARSTNSETFGGWVAEQYKAFNSMSPWLFQFLLEDDFQAETPGTAPPHNSTPSDNWTKSQLIHFLYTRRSRKADVLEVSIIGSNSKKRRARKAISGLNKRYLLVLANMVPTTPPSQQSNNDSAPYTTVEDKNGKRISVRPFFSKKDPLPGKEVYELFPCASRYFSVLMDTSLTGEYAKNRAQAYAMYSLVKFVHVLKHTSDSPLEDFRRKACLFGMLRACTHLTDIPWLKSIHEGNDMGEGIVKLLRKLVPDGPRGGWSKSVITRYYRIQAMILAKYVFPQKERDIDYGIVDSNYDVDNVGTKPMGQLHIETEASILSAMRKFRRFKNEKLFLERLFQRGGISVVAYAGSASNNIRLAFVTVKNQKDQPATWYVNFLKIDKDCEVGSLVFFRLSPDISQPKQKITSRYGLETTGYVLRRYCIGLPKDLPSASKRTLHQTPTSYALFGGDGSRLDANMRFVFGL